MTNFRRLSDVAIRVASSMRTYEDVANVSAGQSCKHSSSRTAENLGGRRYMSFIMKERCLLHAKPCLAQLQLIRLAVRSKPCRPEMLQVAFGLVFAVRSTACTLCHASRSQSFRLSLDKSSDPLSYHELCPRQIISFVIARHGA